VKKTPNSRKYSVQRRGKPGQGRARRSGTRKGKKARDKEGQVRKAKRGQKRTKEDRRRQKGEKEQKGGEREKGRRKEGERREGERKGDRKSSTYADGGSGVTYVSLIGDKSVGGMEPGGAHTDFVPEESVDDSLVDGGGSGSVAALSDSN
jgi:hypothetical protein